MLTVVAFAAIVGWVLFHPEMQPDAQAIAPGVRAGVEQAGFRSTVGVSTAKFKSTRTVDGSEETLDVTQELRAVDHVLTEKRSRRRAKFYFEESVGLYAGPLTIVRHTRSVLPIIGLVLPRQFWASSRVSSFVVQQVDSGFPREAGSTLLAHVTFEDRYADGELAARETMRLRCAVVNVAAASTLDRRLPGLAARIECEEGAELGRREAFGKEQRAIVLEGSKYSHWYVVDLGWSIAVDGERTFKVDERPTKETWKNQLDSFESSS